MCIHHITSSDAQHPHSTLALITASLELNHAFLHCHCFQSADQHLHEFTICQRLFDSIRPAHSVSQTCWRQISNPLVSLTAPALEQHKWKDLKAIFRAARRPRLLIVISGATLSKALWERAACSSVNRRAGTYLCPSQPHQSLLCTRLKL